MVLTAIAIFENYPSKIIKKVFDDKENYNPHTNWMYRQELSLFEYYKKNGNAVMLGNSITYRVDWNELLDRNDVLNRGIGGDTTEGMLIRLEHVINVLPQICFIMAGINDILLGRPLDNISENLKKMSMILRQNGIKPVIFSILYVGENFPNYDNYNKIINQVNLEIYSMCIDNKIHFVDINKVLSNGMVLSEKYSFDGIHLNGQGYDAWSQILIPILNDNVP